MPERKIETIYPVKSLNQVFALSSLLMMGVSVWIVYADYVRPWRVYQRQFRTMETERTQTAIAQEEERLKKESGDKLAELQQKLDAATASIAQKGEDLKAAQAALTKAQAAHYPAEQNMKFKKAVLDVVKFEAEDARHKAEQAGIHDDPKAAAKRTEVDRLSEELAALRLVEEEKRKERDAAQHAVDAILGEQDTLKRSWDELTREKGRLQKNLNRVAKSFVNDYFRNVPMLDFIAPSEKVQQIVVPTLVDDIGFETRIPKVERCTTCHLSIDRPDWADAPAPFKAHPRIALPPDAPKDARPDFLAAKSAHPMDTFACTVCHGGQPRAVEFHRANHAPNDAETAARWQHDYHWHVDHYWDFPMLPKRYTEASCIKCHKAQIEPPGAPKVSLGKHLFQKNGCFGCHNVSGLGFEGLRKVGPDLRHVSAKVEPDWAYKWIRDPRAFRPSTKMPKIFDLSNTSEPQDIARADVAIEGIVAYLMAKSEAFELPTSAPAGDAARGKTLFDEVGCRGCHVLAGEKNGAAPGYEDFGPNLSGVGSKLKKEWIYQWVKDPRAYFPETRMPDLRITDQEAADIAEYLATLTLEETPGAAPGTNQAAAFGAVSKPPLDEALLDALVTEQLHKTMRLDEAKAKLGTLGKDEKLVYLGERMIARQGCFGCHNIPGFEQAQPIGTDLTDQGRKLVLRLDFGFQHEIPHTLHDFIWNKLKEPRQFDHGRIKESEDKLKMPWFDFTDAEAEAITCFVLGLTKEEIQKGRHKLMSPRELEVDRGRRIVRDRNCTGCHIIEGKGGDIRAFYAEERIGNAPPILYGQGAKVNSDWLFSFFKSVIPIRPWLKVRMPTFHFADGDAEAVARYFAAFDGEPYPFVTHDAPAPPPDRTEAAGKLFTQCMNCHVVGEPPPGKDPAQLAPNLLMAQDRLRAKWIADWLKDPQKMLPGTKMPNFFYDGETPLYPDADEQIAAMQHYILNLDADTVLAQAKAAAAAAPPPTAGPAESYE